MIDTLLSVIALNDVSLGLVVLGLYLLGKVAQRMLKQLEKKRYGKHKDEVGIEWMDVLCDVDSKYALCVGFTLHSLTLVLDLSFIAKCCELYSRFNSFWYLVWAVLVPIWVQLMLFGFTYEAYSIAYKEDVLRYNIHENRVNLFTLLFLTFLGLRTLFNCGLTAHLIGVKQLDWIVSPYGDTMLAMIILICGVTFINAKAKNKSKLNMFFLKLGIR